MALKEYPLEPVEVPKVKTKNRCIQTPIPVPESIPLLQRMRDAESRSMRGQAPIIWEKGKGVHIFDPYGNQWLDFSSGVLVTACGYGNSAIVKALTSTARTGIYHAYCFPTEVRAQLAEKLAQLAPDPLTHVFLLTTGAEATECCIKLTKTWGLKQGGKRKRILVSFENGFHGRTLGAQLAGGSPALKEWIGEGDYGYAQVPFPDGFRQPDVDFSVFEKSLAAQGIDPADVCGVMVETYQGCNACLLPVDYAQALRQWCDQHQALLIFDEVQAGFGRTGKWFGFEHFGVVPDLCACGKGVAGGMPLSAVIGREEIMNQYGPGEMTSTHSANPMCSAAALANIEQIEKRGLVEKAAQLEPVLLRGAKAIQKASNGHVGRIDGKGLVVAIQFTQPGTCEPDPDLAFEVYRRVVESGVMLFSPVGVNGCCIKLNPPLIISRSALREGLEVIREVVAEVCAKL